MGILREGGIPCASGGRGSGLEVALEVLLALRWMCLLRAILETPVCRFGDAWSPFWRSWRWTGIRVALDLNDPF